MGKEFLSQDEVDALLQGVTGEPQEKIAEQDAPGVRPYNLATQERIVRGRMPTLEIVNERFARLLRIGLFNFMRRTAEITVAPIRVVKYSEFVRNLVMPTNLNLVHAKPLRGTSLFIFDPTLIFLVIDNLFGSDGRFHTRVEGREFTPTEHRIIQRILSVVFENFEKAWEQVYPLKFEFVRSEMNTQFANIATPNEVVVATSFNIELGSSGGALHVCMPYAMIEPIRDLLYSGLNGETLEGDKRWVRMLSRQIKHAEIELVANLGQIPATLSQVLKMKAGDIIAFDIPQSVVAEADNVPVMECKYGVFNGQYSLKVDKMLNTAGQNEAEQDR